MAWEETHRKNSNFIVIITGLPGRGKSELAAQMAWLLDRDYLNRPRASVKNWTCTQKEFTEAVNANGQYKGRVIVWEEPYVGGVSGGGANSRRFMTESNLQISTLFQTMRHNNHIIILTLPFSGAFDLQARNVAHATIYVNRNNGEFSTSQFYLREANPIFNTTYNKRLQYIRDGKRYKLYHVLAGPAPDSFYKYCLEKSNWYKNKWQNEITQGIKVKKDPKVRRAYALVRITKDKQKFTKEVKTPQGIKDTWNYAAVARTFGISISTAKNWVLEATYDPN